MIVPSSNTNAEPDCLLLAPPGVTIHTTRSGGYDVAAIPDSDEMRRFARQALDQLKPELITPAVLFLAHERAEGEMVREAFMDDLGGGD